MDYKIIFFDLDGTLLNSKHEISQKSVQIIKKLMQSGVYAVPATGRSDLGVKHIVKSLNLKELGSFMLCYNGGKIIEYPSEQVFFTKHLDLSIAQKGFDLAKSLNLAPMTFNETGIISCDVENKHVLFEKELTGLPLYKFSGNLNTLNVGINKILCGGDEQTVIKAQEIVRREMGDVADVFRSMPVFLEIVPKGINKALGVQKILERLKIKPEQAIACGDSFNDYEMLKHAGLALATGNAKQEIKEIAHEILPTNNEDAVAFAIEKYFGVTI